MKGLRRDPERREIRLLRRRASLDGARVLEIGCGFGRLTRRFASSTQSVVSLDSASDTIAQACRLTPARLRKNVRFEIGSAETLSFRDHCFDVAILSWSL
ncbi:MAG: class I SAM-dependent methyltransferase [Candidatus Latescibacteria bacterium]|nr:class I SAM-dependent methyltransferase [Candidatus Latescibacterota bacterium]